MKNQTIMNRKSAKKLLMVQWSRFQNVCIELEGSTLVTGVNGSGKSTVLDAMTYLLTGNTQFNKAAKDRDRTVLGYVRGDTRSNGEARYLRNGSVVSYIAMEFSDPTLGVPLTVGVCIESPSESGKPVSSWFICPGAAIDDIDFTRIEGNALRITPKNELTVNGEAMKLSSFMGRDRGTEAVLRALGLRVDAAKYRTKLLKMMAFNPENNIDQFIQDCVLEPGKVQSLEELREQKRQFERLRELYESLRQGKIQLEEVLRQSDEYEKKKRVLPSGELMLSYQALREKEEEEKQTKNRYQALKDQYGRLTERAGELIRQQEAAQERLRIAENNDMVKGMQESLDSLKRQIEEADREKKNWEDKLAQILKLKKKISALIKLLEADLPSLSSENTYLETLEQADGETAKKREAFDAFREKVHRQDAIYEENKIHLQDQCKEREKEIGALQEKIRRLESNILVFPAEVENARNKIQRGLEKQGIQTEVHIFAELVQEVTAPEWRKAVETFLGRKRFYIIVDGAHCHKAMQILQKERIYDGNVVITDKLPETEAVEGSAAEILRIPNVYARRYANYLLNGIHLCENLEELHEYPKGGLMRDGMLAKSYAVAMMDMRRTELCLGADAIRWYFYINSAPWLPNRFHGKAVVEGQRKFMGTLWNTYAFFVLYANIDDFDATKYALEYDKLSVMDKWLLSKLNTLIKTVDNHLANYQIPEAARALQDFVDDMSNWYVRRSRERFWAKGMEQDKINAYMTLYTALVTVSKVAAPMIPFMTEEIYQNLVRSVDESAPESIHLCDYPVANEAYIDKTLEENMDEVLKIVVMGRACRNTANIKNRQPIGKMFVKGASDLPEFYQDIVTDELNVKEIELTDDVRAFTSYTFKPQLKTVGPKYGKLLGGIKNELSNLDGNAAMDELNATGVLKLQVNGQEIELTKEDLLIDMAQMEGYVSESDYGITVVLDTNLTEELLTEGFVREIISKIQTMRKEAGFEVMDKIKVTYDGSEKAEKVFAEYAEQIGQETLAVAVEKAEPAGYVKDWKINGEAVNMGVEKQGE